VTFPVRDFTVDVALDVTAPTALVGPSGAGKSTTLRLIAGLLRPASGEITCNGETWFGPGVHVPVERRRIGFVFQDYALFPHRNVVGNVAFEARRDPDEVLRQLGIEHLSRARPRDLSGGERQRVALARALAQDADILLMDEPFGALDAMTRDILHDEIERIWQERRLTVLFVTHNVREAARLGDRIVLLSSRPGRVVEDWRVDIPRPRRIDSPEVAAIAAQVTDRLRQEVRRHGH
jgi:NitT/TauT family transport system ATP-binding protein